jgi:hypothetical protein
MNLNITTPEPPLALVDVLPAECEPPAPPPLFVAPA